MVYAGQTAFAEVAVFGERGTVLEAGSLVVLGEVLVVWLWEAVGQVVQLLWQPDSLQQLLVRLRRFG